MHSSSVCKYSSLFSITETLTQDDGTTLSNATAKTNNRLTAEQVQNDHCCFQWKKCLDKCHTLINDTNNILSTIQSPAVCKEVVYSVKGQRLLQGTCSYIFSGLHEIYSYLLSHTSHGNRLTPFDRKNVFYAS